MFGFVYSGKQLWIWDQNKEILGVLHNAYIGGFENGMRSNRGTFYYANGAIYQVLKLFKIENRKIIKIQCIIFDKLLLKAKKIIVIPDDLISIF